MHTIIAGRVGTQECAERVTHLLRARGVAAGDIQSFYVNPPGQHDATAVGGDVDQDPGLEKSSSGLTAGAVAGAAVGVVAGAAAALVAAPLIAPALLVGLAGAGAHVGGLAGVMSSGRDGEEEDSVTESEHPGAAALDTRRGGMMVAVRATPALEQIAIDSLREIEAKDIERASGQWEDGDWKDFDPLQPPRKIDAADAAR